jgi:hypothetical protein
VASIDMGGKCIQNDDLCAICNGTYALGLDKDIDIDIDKQKDMRVRKMIFAPSAMVLGNLA